MSWLEFIRRLFCKPYPVSDCEQKLGQCQLDLGDCQTKLGDMQASYDELTEEFAIANVENSKLKGELARMNLLKAGPEPPAEDKLRTITGQQMNDLLYAKLGQKYLQAPHFFSDELWFVTASTEVDRYLKFFKENWLPMLNPYTVIEWKNMSGQTVQIYSRDCDDFADFFQGVASLYLGWSGVAWGNIWAVVNGLFMSGGHAFNFVPTYRDTYNEVGINGLDLWLIEPQYSSGWTVNGKPMSAQSELLGYELKPASVFALYNVESIMMVKV